MVTKVQALHGSTMHLLLLGTDAIDGWCAYYLSLETDGC